MSSKTWSPSQPTEHEAPEIREINDVDADSTPEPPPVIHTERLHPWIVPRDQTLLTTEKFLDYMTSLSSEEISQLRQLAVHAFPLPVYPKPDAGSYLVFGPEHLFTLFPTLQLDRLDLYDAFHGPDVEEDGWGHDAMYNDITYYATQGRGWKELVFYSCSDRWFRPERYTTSHIDGTHTEGWSTREPQPSNWDKKIKERDGKESGAMVELFLKTGASTSHDSGAIGGETASRLGFGAASIVGKPGEAGDELGAGWEKVEIYHTRPPDGAEATNYQTPNEDDMSVGKSDEEDQEEAEAVAIAVRIRRGHGADYLQGPWNASGSHADRWTEKLHDLMAEYPWTDLKAKGLFIPGAEEDPTAHL